MRNAHIQLAGDTLTNNHPFKLLSSLLVQTLDENKIARMYSLVNPKSSYQIKIIVDSLSTFDTIVSSLLGLIERFEIRTTKQPPTIPAARLG